MLRLKHHKVIVALGQIFKSLDGSKLLKCEKQILDLGFNDRTLNLHDNKIKIDWDNAFIRFDKEHNTKENYEFDKDGATE